MPALKPYLQHFLKEIGLYYRVKASFLYDLYWTVMNDELVKDERTEVKFYRSLLTGFREGDLIFDIGANHGAKTGIFLRLGARVIAVEPDELNKKILEKMFLRLRVFPKPVTVVSEAVSDTNSVATMWIDEPGSAKNTFSRKWVDSLRTDDKRFGQTLGFAQQKEVSTVTLEQLTTRHGLPFFIKIDVEGHELSVLKGMKRAVPYLSFEVNLPDFRSEGLQCIEELGRLAADGKFNYAVDCQQGLLLKEWVNIEEFSNVLRNCSDPSIEVFWKTLPADK